MALSEPLGDIPMPGQVGQASTRRIADWLSCCLWTRISFCWRLVDLNCSERSF